MTKKKDKTPAPRPETKPVEDEKKARTPANPPTKKLACTCSSEFQDREFGKGIRLFNRAGKSASARFYRCTVCLREVNA